MRDRFIIALIVGLQVCLCAASAEELKGAVEREFPVSIPAARAALQNLGAYTGGRLPTLVGFTTEEIKVDQYQRPYYEYKIDMEPVTPARTKVQVKADVSVWYEGPDGPPGYQSLHSNGRLENDLLDRLSDYLKDKSDDPKVLSQTIADLKAKRAKTDKQISLLQEQLQAVKAGTGSGVGTEFVSVRRHVAVLEVPARNAKTLLQARAEDEFAVVDHRADWVKIDLGDGKTGWVKRADTIADAAMPVTGAAPAVALVPGFSVIREQVTDFSGDWARLRSKRALYVWARADGSILNVGTGDRLAFVEKVFSNRYREIAHGAGEPVDGVVIIFLDQRGGVAAATLDDIRLWVEGSINSAAFLKRCSLDPASAFQEATVSPRKTKERKVSFHTAGLAH